MYRWLADKLGNVSVNRKLGIGFGLVLLLTLLITFTGWTGMSGMISRGDKLGIHLQPQRPDQGPALRAWTMKCAWRTRHGRGQRAAGQARQRPAIRPRPDRTACRRAMIDQQLAAVAVQARLRRDDPGRPAVKTPAANSAPPPTTPWPRSPKWKNRCCRATACAFNSVIELSKLIQQARFQVRGYTYSGKTEAEQPALDAIDNALKNLESLPANCPSSQPATGRRLAQGLPRGGQPVPRSQVASAKALPHGGSGRDPARRQQEAHESQTVVRDTDAAHAKNMLIATALALAFGLLAAWAITRQIIIPLNQTLKVAERIAAGDLTTT
jgi:methyl-accepting chemotaxis protein